MCALMQHEAFRMHVDVRGTLGFLCACRCQGVLHAHRVCMGVEASCVHMCVEGARKMS